MKERVIILAEGGACGNFIATLLQTFHVPNILDSLEMPDNGSMDQTAGIGSLTYKYFIIEKKFSIYPEHAEGAMDLVMNAFNNPADTYKRYQSDYEKEFQEIHVIHYQRPENINKFLSLTNTKVIFVRYDPEDSKRIAVNKISKTFSIHRGESIVTKEFFKVVKNQYGALLDRAELTESANKLRSLDEFSDVSKDKELINALIVAWQKYISVRQQFCSPSPHENLTILNFNDLYFNKEAIIQSLSEFTNLPINNGIQILYNKYLLKQPNITLY